MASLWPPEQLSKLLGSAKAGLTQAESPNFPSLSPEDEQRIREMDPSSTDGCILRTFQDLLDHNTDVVSAADYLGSIVSRHCSLVEGSDASMLWGAICERGETWEGENLVLLADLVVELAKLEYSLPAYPYDTDEPVQGTNSFADLPGLGRELHGRLQGPKCYALRFMTPEARNDPSARTPESMTEGIVDGHIVVVISDLYRNINTFAALVTERCIAGPHLPSYLDNRGMALNSIVGALENELSNNEITRHADGSATMPAQDFAAFRTPRPSIELPAATQWLSTLGSDLYDGVSNSSCPAGPLWEKDGGSEKITMERWLFWQERLRYCAANDTILGDGIKDSCAQAADRMTREV